MQTLAAQVEVGLGRTGQGWTGLGLCNMSKIFPNYVQYMLKICQNYAGVIPKICPSIIYSVIKTGLGLCYSTLSQRASLLRKLGD